MITLRTPPVNVVSRGHTFLLMARSEAEVEASYLLAKSREQQVDDKLKAVQDRLDEVRGITADMEVAMGVMTAYANQLSNADKDLRTAKARLAAYRAKIASATASKEIALYDIGKDFVDVTMRLATDTRMYKLCPESDRKSFAPSSTRPAAPPDPGAS
jgi:uncharacterized protein (UPF0305 family)